MAENGIIKYMYKKITGNGRVKNHSSKTLWVVENDTKHRPVARKLGPNRKTSLEIDADGFKRVDGVAIDGHKFWWKIWGRCTADINNGKKDPTHYYVELYGWITRSRAISLAARDKIDNAVVVQPKKGKPYLRSRPDSTSENNFSTMG